MSLGYVLPRGREVGLRSVLEFHGDTYLSLTPASAASTLRLATVSVWFRLAVWDVNQYLVFAGASAADAFLFRIQNDNIIACQVFRDGGVVVSLTSTNTVADSEWHHVVANLDMDNATSAHRARLYLDGAEVTYGAVTRPGSTGVDYEALFGNVPHVIGRYNPTPDQYWQGLMGDTNLVHGQALGPEEFGETVEGAWVWRSYTGSHGQNGMRFRYNDPADVGKNTAVA